MFVSVRHTRYGLIVGVLATAITLFVMNSPGSEAASRCEASGSTLGAARAAYGNNCQAPRVDCDPVGGRWICSSERIGSSSPKQAQAKQPTISNQKIVQAERPVVSEQPVAQPSQQVLSNEQQQQIFGSVLAQLPAEQQQTFIAQLQELSPNERQQLAQAILQQTILEQSRSQTAAEPTPEPASPSPGPEPEAAAASTQRDVPTSATTQPQSPPAPAPSDLGPTRSSVAYVGVTTAQWDEIAAQAQRFGDPNDCRSRVASISANADVVVNPGDAGAIQRALDSGARVISMQGGTYAVSQTIRIGPGQQLVGANGQTVTIDASGAETGVTLGSNSVLANVAVVNADNIGVSFGASGLAYRVSVGRTGYNPTVNSAGAGFSMIGGGSRNNCVVSSEAYEGFNENGRTCEPCANGGNADGVAVKAGSANNSIIDTHTYRNSDDGYDFWDGGSNYVYFGSSFENGKIPGRSSGDGNGYKLGRGDATHYLYKVRAYANMADGIDRNTNLRAPVLVQAEASGNGNTNFDNVSNG